MSSLVSVRLNDELFEDLKERARNMHLSQTDYIRKAIEMMNASLKMQQRNERLRSASLRVRQDSLRINAEFGDIEYDPEY